MSTTTPIKLTTLSYVIIYIKDTQKAISFYRDILGLKVKVSEDNWVELDTGSTTLCLHKYEHDQEKKTGSNSTMIFNVDDIHAAYESLKTQGIKFDAEPHVVCGDETYEGKAADFKDPDGNCLAIYGTISLKK